MSCIDDTVLDRGLLAANIARHDSDHPANHPHGCGPDGGPCEDCAEYLGAAGLSAADELAQHVRRMRRPPTAEELEKHRARYGDDGIEIYTGPLPRKRGKASKPRRDLRDEAALLIERGITDPGTIAEALRISVSRARREIARVAEG